MAKRVLRAGVSLVAALPKMRGSSLEDLLGCTGYRGPRVTVEQMDAAIARGARRTSRR
jgi:hypothetical protein